MALEVLRSVDAKTYTLNDRGGESRIGFVAQEVEAALPEGWGNIVSQLERTEEETAYDPPLKSLDYARLSAVLWQCCKDLDARVQALEAQQSVKPEASKKRKAS